MSFGDRPLVPNVINLYGMSLTSPVIFTSCKGLSTVLMPEGATIRNGMFHNSTLTTLGNESNIKYGVVNLDGYLLPTGTKDNVLMTCLNVKIVNLGSSSVLLASKNTFKGCTALTRVYADPKSATSYTLGQDSFASADNATLYKHPNLQYLLRETGSWAVHPC